ncbi:MAG: hypothetical protein ACRDFQ_04320 [Anaerolineales bacterium]
MLAPITFVQPLITLRRPRLLPVDGTVLVNMGDRVSPKDIVARGNLFTKHIMLDAGHALRLSPAEASQLIQRNVGEYVESGSIIAGRRGIGARQLRAPMSGKIAAIRGGQILLRAGEESLQVEARIPGIITDMEPEQGVVIECVCAWVQAIWGNGRLDEGRLQIIGDGPTQSLTADQIDLSQRGVILVVGTCEQRQALDLAAQVPARGLILGSLATRLLPMAESLPFPIVLTEGFGRTAMNSDAFKLLSNHNGRQAAINAQKLDAIIGDRPEIVIPLGESGKPPEPVPIQSFRIGQNVRAVSGELKGKIGEITALLSASTQYDSGLRAAGAEVSFDGIGPRSIPLANLELLG